MEDADEFQLDFITIRILEGPAALRVIK